MSSAGVGRTSSLMMWPSRSSCQSWKWLGFVTAVWVQSISGNNYTFSNYSDALKTLMGLTQLQLNNLSVAKDVGKAFGILAGLASDRFPTSLLLLIGSVEGFVGYGVQWLVVSRAVRPLPYWQMCVYLCLGGNSTTWMNTAVLVTCMRNFRRNRGPVSGILKGYVGLSTAIFTDICAALFSNDPSHFLFMLAVVPLVVCVAAMLFLNEIPEDDLNHLNSAIAGRQERNDTRYFSIFNLAAIVIAFYLLAYDTMGRSYRETGWIPRAFAGGLLVLLAAPLGLPLYLSFRKEEEPSQPSPALNEPLLSSSSSSSDKEENGRDVVAENKKTDIVVVVGKGGKPEIGEDHMIKEVVVTVEFWVLFVSFLCGVGTGLAVQNNMGQMGLAMGYADVSIFVSIFSIFGFFGRIGSGFISEYFIETAAIPRPLWNAVSQIFMAVGYIVMALGLPGSLYVGSIVVGLCYGVRLAISVPTASELFGLKYFGLVYNILILNLPLGSFLFSGLLAGLLYDAQATKNPDGGNTCVGSHCYRLVFLIMSLACLVGFGLDVLLAHKTRLLYQKISAAKRSRKHEVKIQDPAKS